MEAGLQHLLATDAGVSAEIGTRIYPLVLPDQPTLPAATYQVISCTEDQTLDGPTGIFTARVQVDCWGNTFKQCKLLTDAVRAALDGFAGTLNDGTVVANMWLADSPADGYSPEPRLYHKQQDFKLIYQLS